MKKKKKTYAVKGMMEYQAVVKIGKATMKVHFSDGSATAMGENPATFTTCDFLTQHAIENSGEFKRGRIFLKRVIELDEEIAFCHNDAVPQVLCLSASEEKQPVAVPQVLCLSASEEKQPVAVPQLVCMEFSNNDDARDFLEREFGLVRSKLVNREAIRSAGKDRGVDISFSK